MADAGTPVRSATHLATGTERLGAGGTQVGRRLLHVEIDELGSTVLSMGALLDEALSRAVTAVVERDPDAAQAVIAGDSTLNAIHHTVRERGFRVLLTQAPVACDLRSVLATLQMSVELERMGDHCVSIAKEAIQVSLLPDDCARERTVLIGTLGGRCIDQIRAILGAVLRRDDDAARGVAAGDDDVDAAYHASVDALMEVMRRHPAAAPCATHLIFIAHHLERIGDRVTNLAEDLVYLDRGEITELD